jgi:hypothetical protein
VKPTKRKKPTSMEGENQVGRRNQLTKNFMPNYRTFFFKNLREKIACLQGPCLIGCIYSIHIHGWCGIEYIYTAILSQAITVTFSAIPK